jgi:serine/threonine protein kinase
MLCPPSTRHELAKLLDFGLVHHIAELERGTPLQDSGRGTPSDDLDPARTATGARFLFGTPLYMSPEAISRPDTIGPRSDLYALGAVGYFLLAGAPVFDALTLGDLCDQQLHAEPIAPSVRLGAAVPEGLERAVLHLLEKDPERRTSSAMAFAQELSALIDAVPWTAEDARNWWAKHGQRRVYAEGSSFVPGDPPRRSAALSLKLDIRLR